MKIAQICRDDIYVRFPKPEEKALKTPSHENEADYIRAMEVKSHDERYGILKQLQRMYPNEQLRLYKQNESPTDHESFVYTLVCGDQKMFVKQFLEQKTFSWEIAAWDRVRGIPDKIPGIPRFIGKQKPENENEKPLIVMEYVDKELGRPPLVLPEVCQMAVVLRRTLESFHKEGVGYVDLSAENIRKSNDRQRYRLVDLGSVRQFRGPVAEPDDYLQVKQYYRPPECRTGELTEGFDIYCYGAVITNMLINGMVHLGEKEKTASRQIKTERFEDKVKSGRMDSGFGLTIQQTRQDEAKHLFDEAFLPAMENTPENRRWPDERVFVDAYTHYFMTRINYLTDKDFDNRSVELAGLEKIFAETSAILNEDWEKESEIAAAFKGAKDRTPTSHGGQSEIAKQFSDLANALIKRNSRDWEGFLNKADVLYKRVQKDENRKIGMAYNYLLLCAAALGAPFENLMDLDLKDEPLYFRWQSRTLTSLREREGSMELKIIDIPV